MLFAPRSLHRRPDENLEKAVSPPWILQHNAGFLRYDANLLVVWSSPSGGVSVGPAARSLTYQLVHSLEALMGRQARFRLRAVSVDGNGYAGGRCQYPESPPVEDYRSFGSDSILTYPLAGGGWVGAGRSRVYGAKRSPASSSLSMATRGAFGCAKPPVTSKSGWVAARFAEEVLVRARIGV